MGEKVTADEMQDVNGTIIEAEEAIRTLGKLLLAGADDYRPGEECDEGDVSPYELMSLASGVLLSLADKLKAATITTDNAKFRGCIGEFEEVTDKAGITAAGSR